MSPRPAGIPIVFVLLGLLSVAPEAHAYLDPSTGSMIVSAIVGLFATAALAVKTYWYKLKSVFRPKPGPRDDEAPGEDAEPGRDSGR